MNYIYKPDHDYEPLDLIKNQLTGNIRIQLVLIQDLNVDREQNTGQYNVPDTGINIS